jgi:hypothetical protein
MQAEADERKARSVREATIMAQRLKDKEAAEQRAAFAR